ncbi:restriction endonuclease subunit S [Streptomyces asiaticus]|uniref:restriction endonuclease subunit S n=1 Tax=Streptomyces asiaticus TaxID=114695 RepID=UPI0037FFD6C0
MSGVDGELPRGWAWALLGELVDVLDHQRVPVSAKERAMRHGPIPYYGASGQVGWIDQPLFNEDLILLGEDGVQFFDPDKIKSYLISGPSWVNNHAHALRPASQAINKHYLNHYLNHFDYHGHANGTTRLKLTKGAMLRIPVALPPRTEQDRIVAALEEQLSRQEAAQPLLENANTRISRYLHSLLHRMTAATGRETTPLRDVLKTGLANGRSVPSLPGGFPVLRLTALSSDYVDLNQRKEGDWTQEQAEPFLVREGDFLISRGNGSVSLVGRGSLIKEKPDPVAYPDTVIRARPDTSKLLPDYLRIIWASLPVRQQIESQARTTAGIHKVNQKILGSIEFPLPSLDDQRSFCAAWAGVEQRTRQLTHMVSASTQRATALRRSLLAEAFAGRLAPQDPNDEPAEELLARIRAEREAAAPKKRRTRRAPAQRKATHDEAPAAPPAPAPTNSAPPLTGEQPTLDLEFPS